MRYIDLWKVRVTVPALTRYLPVVQESGAVCVALYIADRKRASSVEADASPPQSKINTGRPPSTKLNVRQLTSTKIEYHTLAGSSKCMLNLMLVY